MRFVVNGEEFNSTDLVQLRRPNGTGEIYATRDYSRVFVRSRNQIEGFVVHEADDFEIRHLIDWHGLLELGPARRPDGLHKRTSTLMKWP